MKIAIIGATGSMGSAIATNLAKAGHELLLSSPDTEKLTALKETLTTEHNATVTTTDNNADAAAGAEIIIPTIWYALQKEVASEIQEVTKGKIVVSMVNPLNETYDGLATPPNTSAAEELQTLLPEATVVKAFNTAFAADYAAPDFGGPVTDIFVAGDDEDAVATISGLVTDAGFSPVFAGPLAISQTLERMMVLLIGVANREEYNWLAGWKILHK